MKKLIMLNNYTLRNIVDNELSKCEQWNHPSEWYDAPICPYCGDDITK